MKKTATAVAQRPCLLKIHGGGPAKYIVCTYLPKLPNHEMHTLHIWVKIQCVFDIFLAESMILLASFIPTSMKWLKAKAFKL